MTQPEYFRHYCLLQEDNPHGTAWLDQIPREQWTLAWDDGRRWGHMTTNLAESINSVLKKMRNFPITALVRVTYEKLNKYYVDRGTQVDAMIASGQVYTIIAAKFINEEETKSNTHFVQQFDRQRFEFQVEERVNLRERRRIGKFTVRLDQRKCDCGKPQKIHMPCAHVIAACKHINIEYLQYVHPVYTLQYVSSVYKVPLAGMRHHNYWPPYEGPQICANPVMRRNKKGRPKSTRIRTNMDGRERGQPKRCSICRIEGHSKNKCPHRLGSSSQAI